MVGGEGLFVNFADLHISLTEVLRKHRAQKIAFPSSGQRVTLRLSGLWSYEGPSFHVFWNRQP